MPATFAHGCLRSATFALVFFRERPSAGTALVAFQKMRVRSARVRKGFLLQVLDVQQPLFPRVWRRPMAARLQLWEMCATSWMTKSGEGILPAKYRGETKQVASTLNPTMSGASSPSYFAPKLPRYRFAIVHAVPSKPRPNRSCSMLLVTKTTDCSIAASTVSCSARATARVPSVRPWPGVRVTVSASCSARFQSLDPLSHRAQRAHREGLRGRVLRAVQNRRTRQCEADRFRR